MTIVGGVLQFLPSESGFAFTNSWPSNPVVNLRTPLGLSMRVGDARGGLCGGMVFAALDYWYAGEQPPTERPVVGDPLYSFIVRRLIDSWHLPAGVAQYYRWMGRPDTGGGGVGRLTITGSLPRLIRDLDGGRPMPLGVVAARSRRLTDLRRNHQVLAYACDLAGDDVTVRVYDPNRGNRDDRFIRFNAGGPAGRTNFEHNLGLADPVRGFFPIRYARVPTP